MSESAATGAESGGQATEQAGEERGSERTEGGSEEQGGLTAADRAKLELTLANERKRTEKVERELAELRRAAMTDQEKAVAEARTEGERIASRKLAAKLLDAEVRAQAAGKLADPADAAKLLDLETLLDDEGEFDPKEIAKALDDLVKAKPYLAPPPVNGHRGGPPQGAREQGKSGAGEGDDFLRHLVRGGR